MFHTWETTSTEFSPVLGRSYYNKDTDTVEGHQLRGLEHITEKETLRGMSVMSLKKAGVFNMSYCCLPLINVKVEDMNPGSLQRCT